MTLAATAGRLPAHTFAEAVKAAYDCCAAPLKVLRAGGTAAANASVIDVAADASELTPRSSKSCRPVTPGLTPHIPIFSGELTADASELEAVSAAPTFTSTTFTSFTSIYSPSPPPPPQETCAMMVAEVCVVRDVWSVLRRPTYE